MKPLLHAPASESATDTEDAGISSASDITSGATHVGGLGTPNPRSPSSRPEQDQTVEQQVFPKGIDLNSLRLPPNYGATLGVKKLLTTVRVGRLPKPQFFRTHESNEMTFAAMLLEDKDLSESYLVMPEVAKEISDLVRPVLLHAAIDRQNNVFLIPVPLPAEDGTRNSWHESLAQAVELAKPRWVRISSNKPTGGYDVYEAKGELPDPDWPAYDIEALIQVAFRGKIITDLGHPVVQSLLGRI
jgi:hypothetical protein